jgi:hypothetical protein
MFRRSMLVAALVVVALSVSVVVGAAKTALTTTNVPSQTKAGEPFKITFGTENHDGVSLSDAAFLVKATPSGGGETLVFPATRVGDAWEADVTLPSAGAWNFRVVDDALGFEQELPSTTVAANPLAPVTAGQLDDALATTRAEVATQVSNDLGTQLAGVTARQDALTQQMTTLAAERDALAQRISSLEAVPAQAQTDAGTPWWAGALLALAAVGLLASAASVVLWRRGGLGRLTIASRHA